MNPDVSPVATLVERRTASAQGPQFGLHDAHSPCRGVLEGHIRHQFWQAYQAEIQQFSPVLLSASQEDIEAVIGLRSAATSPLFLEAYLNQTIEETIRRHTGSPTNRSGILEIGNLVSLKSGSSSLLFLVTCYLANASGFEWLVFTATPQVQKLVKRFNVSPLMLDHANGEKLGKEQAMWGKYYATKPTVMALSVVDAITIANANPMIKSLSDCLDLDFATLADTLTVSFNEQGVQ